MVISESNGKENISIDKLIAESDKKGGELRNKLYNTLPLLLDYVFTMEYEKGYCPTLTNSFREKNNSDELAPLELSYIAMRDKILLIAFDTSSDTVDPGRGYTKEVSKTEFLEWTNQNLIRMLDVYNHLVEYIKSPPVRLENPEDSFSKLGII